MVDYSKWKDIEISDDEDETHPNIDTPSLFRWRHQARVERMEQSQKEREDFEAKKSAHMAKINAVKEKINKGEGYVTELQESLEILTVEAKKLDEEDEEFRKKDKKTPWNVDTISKPGFEKTVINQLPLRKNEELTEEEREKRMKEFIKQHEKTMKKYGMLRKYDDSKRFLMENNQLVCEDTANYLVIWCIELEMEQKHELMGHVAHQCICMQYILELSRQLDVDPRSCVNSFFTKIQDAVVEYKEQFDQEVRAFRTRIENRAQEKINDAIAEQEEEDRKARLGPGGLDPVEVMETLPEELKKCFESQDVKLLQQTIASMSVDDATFHMKRCVDSGLWVPEGGTKLDISENPDEENTEDQNDDEQEKAGPSTSSTGAAPTTTTTENIEDLE